MFDAAHMGSDLAAVGGGARPRLVYGAHDDPYRDHNASVLREICGYIDQTRALVASDFDGVVGFTERRQMRNFGAAVIELVGRNLSERDKQNLSYEALAPRMLGKSEAEIMETLKNEYELPGTVDELVKFRGDLYYKSMKASSIQANPFVVTLMEHTAQVTGRKPIIVSNGRQKIQVGLLKHFGCSHLVDEVHTSDTMMLDLPLHQRKRAFFGKIVDEHGKVVVLEDSAGMAQHVERLGAKVVYVRHALNRHSTYTPQSGLVFRCASLAQQ